MSRVDIKIKLLPAVLFLHWNFYSTYFETPTKVSSHRQGMSKVQHNP